MLPCDLEGAAGADRRFAGVARLYGAEAAAALRAAHVTVVGIGGVGSWAAEALARCGVGTLTLIDLDHIAESNINRQVHALEPELGKAKVLAMRERIAQISPQCTVHGIEEFVDASNVAQLIAANTVVLDCIDRPGDTSARKVALVFALKPVIAEDGTCECAKGDFKIKSTVPERKSKNYEFNVNKKGHLLYSTTSPEAVDQTTFDDLDENGRVRR